MPTWKVLEPQASPEEIFIIADRADMHENGALTFSKTIHMVKPDMSPVSAVLRPFIIIAPGQWKAIILQDGPLVEGTLS